MTTAHRLFASAAAAGLSVLLLSACFGGPVRDEDGTIIEGGSTSANSIAVGDCLDDPQAEQIVQVKTVPCTDPHDYEAYAEGKLAEGDYPADLDDQAADICLGAFEGYVGTAFDDSELDVTYFTPTPESWGIGDRIVTCLLIDPAGRTAGSLKASGR